MAAGEHEDPHPRVVLKGGASFVGCKPLFSADSKFLLVASGFVIKVLSVRSGECVRELKGHKAKITSVGLHPSNNFQVYSCSQDQTIIKWDFTDGAILKRYKCPNRLHLLTPTHLEDPEFVGIAQVTKSECEVVQFSLPTKDTEVEFTTLESRMPPDGSKVSFGCKGEIMACVRQKSLMVRSLTSKLRKEHVLKVKDNRYKKEEEFTVVLCHPKELCVATGTNNGAIHLWYNFMSHKKVVSNTLHWHALPVRALSFTPEGSYLLSGGHECVLVKWQHNTQMKDTLPRLGAPIIHIANSHDNLHYATCHSDNSIQVINSQFRVKQVYVGLTQAHLDEADKDQIPVGLLLDPRTSALVLNGRPGHLQFYNLHSDKQLYCVDIVCQNYISPENLRRPLVLTQLIRADFSTDGDWLVTVEYRNDKETTPEQRLKFWLYDAKQQTYTLNTSVELPHAERIETLRFRPAPADLPGTLPTVVTTSQDGSFKLWQVTDDSDIYRTRSCWSCESVGYYRNLPAGDADFSEDGSVLAVAFDSTLTLWDPDTNGLRQAFPMKSKIRGVLFGSGTSSHLVAVATRNRLSTLNLLTCSAGWSTSVKMAVMCRHNPTGHLAVFTTNNQLLVFDLASPEPVYHQDNVSNCDVKAAIFVPHAHPSNVESRLPWQRYSQLYFLNAKQELLTLTEEAEVIEGQMKVTERLPETPFSLILSEERRRKLQAPEPQRYGGLHGKPGAEYLKEMLSTPAHVLPPVSSLCVSFMDRLMIANKTASRQKQSLEDMDDDDDEDSKDNDSDDSESDMEVDGADHPAPPTMTPPSEETQRQPEAKGLNNVKANMLTWLESL